jgi:hypothetical protein
LLIDGKHCIIDLRYFFKEENNGSEKSGSGKENNSIEEGGVSCCKDESFGSHENRCEGKNIER